MIRRPAFSFYWRKPANASLQQAIREWLEPTHSSFLAESEISHYSEDHAVCVFHEARCNADELRKFCRSYGVAYVIDESGYGLKDGEDEDKWFFWAPHLNGEQCGKSKIAEFKLFEQRRSQAEPLLEDLPF